MHAIPEMKPETRRLRDFLQGQPIETVITPFSIRELTGYEIGTPKFRSCYTSAARSLYNTHNQVWKWVRGIGLVHLRPGARVEYGAAKNSRLGRQMGRNTEMVRRTDISSLTNEEKMEYQKAIVLAGVLSAMRDAARLR